VNNRCASVLVCDDIRLEISGKLIIIGAYTQDIVIPSDEFVVNQIYFLFLAECQRSEPFKSLKFEVTLPGNEPVAVDMGKPPPLADDVMPERERLYVRQAIQIPAAKLRPGKIMARVIHDGGVINAGAGWIVKASPAPPAPNTNP
jgi:hypothetical protein